MKEFESSSYFGNFREEKNSSLHSKAFYACGYEFPEKKPFRLNDSNTFSVYLQSPDYFEQLSISGFLETLKSANIEPHISENINEASLILMKGDPENIKPEGYELQIRSEKIILMSNDRLGMLYSLYTLKQIFGHSFENRLQDFQSSVYIGSPALSLRAVHYSFNFQIQDVPNETKLKSLMYLSQIYINTILIYIDDLPLDKNSFKSTLLEYVELCSPFHIKVIPVLDKEVNLDLIGQLLDSIPKKFDSLILGENLLSCISKKELFLPVISSISASFDLDKLILCTHNNELLKWLETEHLNYLIILWPSDTFNPLPLINKPLIFIDGMIQAMDKTFKDVINNSQDKLVFPMNKEQDILCPDILLKFYLAIFGLCSYNHLQSGKVISKNNYYLNDLLRMLLGNEHSNFTKNDFDIIFSLWSGQRILSKLQNHTLYNSEDCHALVARYRLIEQSFLSFFSMDVTIDKSSISSTSSNSLSLNLVPSQDPHTTIIYSREEMAICVHLYSNILYDAHYSLSKRKLRQRMNQSLFHPILEDLYTYINIYYIICKSIHQTLFHNSLLPLSSMQPSSQSINNPMNDNGFNPATNFASPYLPKRAAVYDNVDMSKPFEYKIFPKSPEITNLLMKVVRQNILFRNIKSEEHSRIVEAFECITTRANEIVIKQGDLGEYFYIVESGSLEVFMETSTTLEGNQSLSNSFYHPTTTKISKKIKIGRNLSRGDYFGELALMYNTPRAATVISSEASTLWRIDRQTYRGIIMYHNKITSDEFYGLVSNVHILGKRLGDVLSQSELNKVVSTLEREEFEDNSIIIRQHQTGDYFYIISEGQVAVWQEAIMPDTKQKKLLGNKLAMLSRGNYFGELALLEDDVRQASCVAVGKVVCLSLSRDDFISMIGNWQDLTAMKTGTTSLTKRNKVRESVYDTQYHVSVHLDELEVLNTLGVGAFGKVKVARHKESDQLYALKIQAKKFIVQQNMTEMVLNEITIMKQVDHPFISKLHGTMQDKKCIYFLLELLPGGEFFTFLQKVGRLDEIKTRFYSATVILALEDLHKSKIAYRDLKPENMVLDARGYLKLVDFGLAKQIPSGTTWTMCGTPDYLAPEIILNKGHNHAVDYWALGVLIYEMVHGWPPFWDDQPMKVYEKVITGKINYPESFSKAFEELISKFLVKNPSKRLGNMKGGVADIIKHKWFGSFDWQGLLAGTLPAPLLPDLGTFDAALAAGSEDDDEDEFEEFEESDWTPEL